MIVFILATASSRLSVLGNLFFGEIILEEKRNQFRIFRQSLFIYCQPCRSRTVEAQKWGQTLGVEKKLKNRLPFVEKYEHFIFRIESTDTLMITFKTLKNQYHHHKLDQYDDHHHLHENHQNTFARPWPSTPLGKKLCLRRSNTLDMHHSTFMTTTMMMMLMKKTITTIQRKGPKLTFEISSLENPFASNSSFIAFSTAGHPS